VPTDEPLVVPFGALVELLDISVGQRTRRLP
jgi:hypothetical protein